MIALAALLYLFDCVVLLERGQAVLEAMRGPLLRRMRLYFGSKHYQIGGRTVALLNPLTPFIPAFRTLPLFADPDTASVRLGNAIQVAMPVSMLGLLQFFLVLAALPYCLYRAPGWPFFTALVLAYLNAMAMLGILWRRFLKAGIQRRPLLSLGFSWLVCLPLSVNCLRRGGLAFDLAMDARRALRFLPGPERQRAQRDLAAQVGEAMQEVEETDLAYRRLAGLMRELAPEASDGRI